MVKKCTLLIIMIVAIGIGKTFSQQYSIKGVVKNAETTQSVGVATVSVKSKADSLIVQSVLTDTAGRFEIKGLQRDTLLLEITAINYATLLKPFVADQNIDLGTVELRQVSQVLGGVTVTTNISPVTQKGDTLQMNANQYKVNPDATTEDLVKKMPGITIENGVVKAQGETVQRVTLDGRDLFGDDATAALRNLPAEIVDKIQVFDRMSDQAQFTGVDDGNTQKGINIITKANMRNGQFGRAFAGAGTDGRYSAGGNGTILQENRRISLVGNFNNINQQNFSAQDLLGVTSSGGGFGGRGGGGGGRGGGGGGFGGGGGNFMVGQQNGINKTTAAGINYTDNWGKKLTVTGSYFFNDAANSTNSSVNREYFLKGIPSFSQNTFSAGDNTNHRVNMRIEYKIDSSNQITITPSVSFQKNASDRSVATNFYNPETLASTNKTTNSVLSDRTGLNLSNNIMWRHSFAKRGRTLSVMLNTSTNSRDGDVFTNLYDTTFFNGGFKDSLSRRFTDQTNSGYNLSANFIYTEPVSKNAQIQINYSPAYNKSEADQQAFQYEASSSKFSRFDPSLSNKFENTNATQRSGLTYRYGTRDNQFNVGVDYQYTTLNSNQTYPRTLTVDQSFNNVLPNAMLRLKINAKSNVRVFYRASTNLPSVNQLQDVYDYTNLPFVTAGNPQLKQQFGQLLGTRYTFTNSTKGILLSANIFGQTASNYITNATFVPIRDSVLTPDLTLKAGQQLSKPVNMNGYANFRSFLTFAMPLKFIKSNLNLNGGVSYSKLPGIINNRLNESKNFTYSAGAVIGSNVSQYVDFTVSYNANFNRVKNQLQPQLNNNYFSHVASVQMNLLSKNGWFFQNDVNNQMYSGLSEGFNQNYVLWNMSVGRKFLAKQRGELKFTVFDLLKQNQAINRNVSETYVEDSQYQVLQQYFMLTFTYSLRNFGSAPAPSRGGGNWGGGGNRPMRPF